MVQEAVCDHVPGNITHGIVALEPDEVVRQVLGADPVERAQPALQAAVVRVHVVEMVDAVLVHATLRVQDLKRDLVRPCERPVRRGCISTEYAVLQAAAQRRL